VMLQQRPDSRIVKTARNNLHFFPSVVGPT
jgi:hypothetical protein